MKKLFYLPILALFILAGCSDVEENNIGASSKWLQFDKASYQAPENTGPLLVPVIFASDSNPDGVSVNFSVTSTSTNFTVSPSNGVLTIPAGELVGYIEVTPNYDPENEITESYSLTIELEDGDFGVGVAGEGVYNTTTTVTFIPSACPFDVSEFVGTYSATEYTNTATIYNYTVTVTEVSEFVVTMSNLWDVQGVSTFTFDTSNPSQTIGVFTNGQFLYTDPTYGAATIGNPSLVGASEVSTVDTCTKFMDLWFTVSVSAGTFTGVGGGRQHVELVKN